MHNILLITVDCLRADRLGYGGNHRNLSPVIDRLADRSVVFSNAFATAPRTAESFPGILTSTFSLTFGGSWTLPGELISLAQSLQQAGYTTAAFHSNPFLSANLGYSCGFDTFWDSSDQTPVTSKIGARVMPRINADSTLYRLLRRLVRQFETSVGMAHYASAEKVTDMALDWLQQQSGPYLLWLHFMDMHYPYAPPERMLRQLRPRGIGKRQQADLLVRSIERPETLNKDDVQVLQDLYDAGLLYVDQQVGRLLDAMASGDDSQDTVVILTADHGEEFLEHGEFGHAGMVHMPDENRTQMRLYDELLHVPLIIRSPEITADQTSALVSLVDIPSTVVDLVGAAMPQNWQGLSLKPLLEGQDVTLHNGVFSEYAVRDGEVRYPIVAYRTTRWKYIHDGAFGNHELYDLDHDPAEQTNLYSPDHPAVADLQGAVLQHLQEARGISEPATEAALDAEMVERLIGLGYLE